MSAYACMFSGGGREGFIAVALCPLHPGNKTNFTHLTYFTINEQQWDHMDNDTLNEASMR